MIIWPDFYCPSSLVRRRGCGEGIAHKIFNFKTIIIYKNDDHYQLKMITKYEETRKRAANFFISHFASNTIYFIFTMCRFVVVFHFSRSLVSSSSRLVLSGLLRFCTNWPEKERECERLTGNNAALRFRFN